MKLMMLSRSIVASLLFAAASAAAAAEPPQAETTAPAAEPEDQPAREVQVAAHTRIEQLRRGNRVVEITVTPAGATWSYTLTNREGRMPRSNQELSAGLSTPSFFRITF
jgi:glucose/arabinose dehydrogenase